MKSLFLLITIFSILTTTIFAQDITVKGKVLENEKPLSFANVIAESKDGSESMLFSMTDDKGQYVLELPKEKTYVITANYLGYEPDTLVYDAIEDKLHDFILQESTTELGQVTINAKLAVSYKKDTITFQADAFATGSERKLRHLLKNMPGVEVDRAGNVKVQGRKVTKLLVEDKQFFTGNTKMGVNNLPADAVEEVEVIDNYSDVGILKDLENSNELAMNINLKEDKKSLIFGDVEIGAGMEERYLVHPNVFYYSPKYSVNSIGDFNNIGEKSFTFKDYLDFEGGYSKILTDPKAYFSKVNDEFSLFLKDRNFKESQNLFAGGNVMFNITDRTDVVGYVIYSDMQNHTENTIANQYNFSNNKFTEYRTNTTDIAPQFMINKIGVNHILKNDGKIVINSVLKKSNASSLSLLESRINDVNTLSTDLNRNSLTFTQDVEVYTPLVDNHVLTIIGNYKYKKSDSNINWMSNQQSLFSQLPIVDADNLSVFQDKNKRTHTFTMLLKEYWSLSQKVHLYTTLGTYQYRDDLLSNEYQLISGQENSFSNDGYGNDGKYHYSDFYVGSEVKYKVSKVTFKPGVTYHKYFNTLQQDEKRIIDKNYLLPKFDVNVDFSKAHKLRFKYKKWVTFPSLRLLSSNFTLNSFNTIYKGNPLLDNEVSHRVNVTYRNYHLFKKLGYNASLGYSKKTEGVISTTVLEEINSLRTPIIVSDANERFSMNGTIEKGVKKFKFSLGSSIILSNYLVSINDDLQRYQSNSYEIRTGLKTNYRKKPNINVSYRRAYNYFTNNTTVNYVNNYISAGVDYAFTDFVLLSDYDYQIVNNTHSSFWNASIRYAKEDSPWSFELKAKNMLNTQFIETNTFNDFLISENKSYRLPRIVLFKVGYQF